MCHSESTALTFNNVDQRDHRWRNQCLYCRTNVKELNSVYFLSSCLVGAAAGILGLTNLAGFLFFFVSLLFSVLCVSACRCVRAAQNHGGASINYAASFVILLIICLMEDGSRPYYPGTQYSGTSSSVRWRSQKIYVSIVWPSQFECTGSSWFTQRHIYTRFDSGYLETIVWLLLRSRHLFTLHSSCVRCWRELYLATRTLF